MTTAPRTRGRWRSLGTASALSIATLIPGLALAGVGTAPAQAAEPTCTASDGVTTCTFSFSGGPQFLTVPNGIRSAGVRVTGAAGGRGVDGRALGGVGGGVAATIAVMPGQSIQVNVGGRGGNGGVGGWNGGGNGASATSPGGGGGGGASEVIVDGVRRVVAGGGGGGGTLRWGELGTPMPGAGGNGGGVPANGGSGVGAGGQGRNSSQSVFSAGGGLPGTTTPGSGGLGSGGFIVQGCSFWVAAHARAGEPGSGASGGAGGRLTSPQGELCLAKAGWGGGGGGGYQGGGGGGAGVSAGAGGGGGSGFGPYGSQNFLGSPDAQGSVTVTFAAAAPSATVPGWLDTGVQVRHHPTTALRGGTQNTFDIFYIDSQLRATQRTHMAGGQLSGPTQIGTMTWPTRTRFAAVSSAHNRIDLFARGDDTGLWHSSFDGVTWSSWTKRADGVASNPTVASPEPGRLDVFWRGTGGLLESISGADDGARWTSVQRFDDIPFAPTATSSAPGVTDVVYDAVDGPYLKRFAGGRWQLAPISTTSRRSITYVASAGTRTLSIYYTDGMGNLVRQRNDAGNMYQWSGPENLGPSAPGFDNTVSVAESTAGVGHGLAVAADPGTGTLLLRAV